MVARRLLDKPRESGDLIYGELLWNTNELLKRMAIGHFTDALADAADGDELFFS